MLHRLFIILNLSFLVTYLQGADIAMTTWYKPTVNTTWQWQLDGKINKNYDVDMYDVDLFDTSKKVIHSLKKDGKKVICYFSAGSYEDWRDDADKYPQNIQGNAMDGWDETWLDIRSNALKSIMIDRISLAHTKGCDGIEPDNVDGYTNRTGFHLTYNDQLQYNKFLVKEAHKQNLAIGLKNDLDQIKELVKYYDFALNEQCNEYNECQKMTPFILSNKPVFNAEYAQVYVNNNNGRRDLMCTSSKKERFQTLVLPLDLDGSFRYSCD